MPTPPKPFTVLSTEKKSHRTKRELQLRKQGEEALASGKAFKVRKEVKENEVAYKEFKRVNNVLKKIKKNDALYESVINRYCLLQAECIEMSQQRNEILKIILEMREEFRKISETFIDEEKAADYMLKFSKQMAELSKSMTKIDAQLQTKRKMLLEIEKENVMTIASALRSIPKKEEKSVNPLLKALADD